VLLHALPLASQIATAVTLKQYGNPCSQVALLLCAYWRSCPAGVYLSERRAARTANFSGR